MAEDRVPPPAERFKVTLLSMAKIISTEISLARSKGLKVISDEIISFGVDMIKLSKDEDIIEGFINRSYNGEVNYWDEVLVKNDNFFLNKKNSTLLFGELSSSVVDSFVDLVNSKQTSEMLVATLWNYLHALVKISIAYIFFERKPQIIKTNDGFNIRYTKETRSHINLEREAEKWKVDLLKVK